MPRADLNVPAYKPDDCPAKQLAEISGSLAAAWFKRPMRRAAAQYPKLLQTSLLLLGTSGPGLAGRGPSHCEMPGTQSAGRERASEGAHAEV